MRGETIVQEAETHSQTVETISTKMMISLPNENMRQKQFLAGMRIVLSD